MNNKGVLGAILGDMVGSTRELNNVRTEDFELLPNGSGYTDDTVMTLAVAEWLMRDSTHSKQVLIKCMQRLGRQYLFLPYGRSFRSWLKEENPKPYNSCGNGSAMRVSPVGLYANSLEEALELAKISAEVSHNHQEGIKGAQAIAACVYLSKMQKSKDEIKQYVEHQFGYNLSGDLRERRNTYCLDVTCQGSVPIAIMAYLQESTLLSQLRLAISMGGDSDTIGSMSASIAMAPLLSIIKKVDLQELVRQCRSLLSPDLLDINDRFLKFLKIRQIELAY